MIFSTDAELSESKQIYFFDQETPPPLEVEISDDTDQRDQSPSLQKKAAKNILFHEIPADLIITDIFMPEKDDHTFLFTTDGDKRETEQ